MSDAVYDFAMRAGILAAAGTEGTRRFARIRAKKADTERRGRANLDFRILQSRHEVRQAVDHPDAADREHGSTAN